MIAGEFGLDTPEKIVSHVYSKDKSAIAAFSPLVDKAFSKGDAVATQIIRSNAESLAQLVKAVASRLGFSSCDVALLGGLMENPTALKEKAEALLTSSGFHCIRPVHTAAEGAVMEALALAK